MAKEKKESLETQELNMIIDDSMEEIITPISIPIETTEDMYNALDQLVSTSYTTATSDISNQFTSASSEVEASLNDLASSRWS